jgi:hypothetical protein
MLVSAHTLSLYCLLSIFKQHFALAEYFLDVVGMDVNVRNDSGMPACWFAAIFISKQDGGAMLRFMMERGIYSKYLYTCI